MLERPSSSKCTLTPAPTAIVYLAEKLCQPVGGVLTNPINYTGPVNNFTNGSSAPVPFTGEATAMQGRLAGYAMAVLAVGLGILLL